MWLNFRSFPSITCRLKCTSHHQSHTAIYFVNLAHKSSWTYVHIGYQDFQEKSVTVKGTVSQDLSQKYYFFSWFWSAHVIHVRECVTRFVISIYLWFEPIWFPDKEVKIFLNLVFYFAEIFNFLENLWCAWHCRVRLRGVGHIVVSSKHILSNILRSHALRGVRLQYNLNFGLRVRVILFELYDLCQIETKFKNIFTYL